MRNDKITCRHFGHFKKIVLTMKLSILFFFISGVSVLANSAYSQNTRLSILLNEVTVKEAFAYIEKNSEYIIVYHDDIIDLDRKISVNVKDASIEKVLEHIFLSTENSFTIFDRQIVINKIQKQDSPRVENPRPENKKEPEEGSGTIRGKIEDEKGLPMIGASIVVENTTIGTVTNANGQFQLLGVPVGRQKILVSFIGYNQEVIEVLIEKGAVVELNLKMTESSVEISGIIAYGQARGQLAAINQQINARGITNVISAERLQELPDVNVAEAVGRLPGMMVERNRGEGQKIIIRGLEPKYNTISIGGIIAPSTSPDDRSTDLNMISPDILGGVEVQKANTADKDADGLGGTVNLTLREAPSGLKMNSSILTGYSGHSNSLSNYRGNFYVSNRFFNDKLGLMLTGNADIAERNSDRMRVSYDVQGVPDFEAGQTFIKPWITNLDLQVNIEDRTRAGGSLLFDWKISPASTIKSSNFIGYLNRHIYDRTKSYSPINVYSNITQVNEKVNQLLYSNSLEGKHFIFGSIFEWGISRAQSINERPYGHTVQFRNFAAFNNFTQGKSFDIEPPELLPRPENINDNIEQYSWQSGRFRTYEATETNLSMFANWQLPFNLGNHIKGVVKAGAQMRSKDRFRANNSYARNMWQYVNVFQQTYPDVILTTEGAVGRISVLNFLDNNYIPGSFLNNQYKLLSVNTVLDRELMSNLYNEYLKEHYFRIASEAKDNYDTHESITAYYLMSEINIGKFISFIPGVRYERTNLNYSGYIADELPSSESVEMEVNFKDTTATNKYNNYFPQIHLRIKPTDWFDIRLAYTSTLSRPDYNQLAPKKLINLNDRTVTLGNTGLNPALSRNYDIIFTFFQPKHGLFTVGAFYKRIEGFIWNRTAMVVANTPTDPENFNLSNGTLGFTIRYPLNNPNLSSIKGFEMDIQSNMSFLPVKGFVLNMNLTLMDSETKYSETLIRREANPDFGVVPGAPRIRFANADTAYVDRLLKQPSYLANIGLGYDNKEIGLSIRLSFNFQDNILIKEQRRPDGADREATLAFYRWDFQMNQRITKRLNFNANISNIFNQPDRSVRLISGYISDLEYYGAMAQIGLKYDLF